MRDDNTYVSGAVRLPRTLRMIPNLYNGFELSARVYVKSLRQRHLLTDRAITSHRRGSDRTICIHRTRDGSRGPASLGGWPLKWGARRISKNAERLTDHSRIGRVRICLLGTRRTERRTGPALDWVLGGFRLLEFKRVETFIF